MPHPLHQVQEQLSFQSVSRYVLIPKTVTQQAWLREHLRSIRYPAKYFTSSHVILRDDSQTPCAHASKQSIFFLLLKNPIDPRICFSFNKSFVYIQQVRTLEPGTSRCGLQLHSKASNRFWQVLWSLHASLSSSMKWTFPELLLP